MKKHFLIPAMCLAVTLGGGAGAGTPFLINNSLTVSASASETSTTYIRDIQIVYGSTAAKAKAKCPSGYTLIDKDLNKGAGGDYMYLCYSTTDSFSAALDGLIVDNKKSNSSIPTSVYSNTSIPMIYSCGMWKLDYRMLDNPRNKKTNSVYYSRIDTDLNKDAGGDYIYLYKQIKTSNITSKIQSLDILVSDHKINDSKYNGYNVLKWYSDSSTNADLNRKAGGAYIYLLYKCADQSGNIK